MSVGGYGDSAGSRQYKPMRQTMGEGEFWITFWAIIAIAVVVTTIGTTTLVCNHTQKMAELGYEKNTIVGSDYAVWQKSNGGK